MTAWTDFLHREGFTLEETGAASLSAAATATEGDCVIIPLPQLGVLHAAGADAASYLHNLLSNEVQQLPADGLVWNSLNTPKGRMIANFLLWPEVHAAAASADQPAAIRLLASADLIAGLHKRLSMYILRSKVKLSDPAAKLAVFALCGAAAATLLASAGLPRPASDMSQCAEGGLRVLRLAADHFILIADQDAAIRQFAALQAAGAQKAGSRRWQLQLIRAGLALISEAVREEFVAQMINFELTGGVNFKKGCYPGQEIVARAQYLGKVKRRMYRLSSSAPLAAEALAAAGSEIFNAAGESVGKLVNAAPNTAGGIELLAVLQSSATEQADAVLHLAQADGPALQLQSLPYALP